MRISRELEQTLTLAVNEAKRRRHEFLCLEHVLYALTFDEDVVKVIRSCGGDIKMLQRDLESFFTERGTQVKKSKWTNVFVKLISLYLFNNSTCVG